MKISEDDSSWKASGIKRRDFRSVRNGPEIPKRSGPRRKKNTKRWCRGKEGKEHKIDSFEKYSFSTWGWTVHKCTECGKEFWRYPK